MRIVMCPLARVVLSPAKLVSQRPPSHPPSGPLQSQTGWAMLDPLDPLCSALGPMRHAPNPSEPACRLPVRSGIAAVDRYLEVGYDSVPGMSSRFSAAICCGLMRIQAELGVSGPITEIGAFEGRFFIALAHALGPAGTA